MKYTYYILISFLFPVFLMGQETTTIIEGQGKSCQEARNDALRNAVNKAAGSVIYSKTEIANDALISDEITMLTSGNILHYDEIEPCSESNGNKTIKLKVTVSQTELKKFIEGKGKSVAISGELLKQKSDQEMASNKAELGIVKNLLLQLDQFTKDPFDYEISIGHVTIKEGKYCDLPADIKIKTNINFYNAYLKLSKELDKISINSVDQNFRASTLKQSNYPITINSKTYYLRNDLSIDLISNFYKKFITKMEEYIIVDDCLKELYLNNVSKEIILNGNLFFPQPGYIAKKISGNFTTTIEEIGSLNRINIFENSKVLQYKNGKSLSGELVLMQYSETNPLEFQALRNKFIKCLEDLAKENDDGKIKLNYNVLFFNDGINKSIMQEINFSQKTYKQLVEKGISEIRLNPSKLCGNFIKTTDTIKLDFKWQTYRSTFVHESNKSSNYSAYINNQNLPNGTYILTIKEKELNNIIYKDVYISNYKTRGPLTMFCSILIPGWGARRVTYSEKKGWDRFGSVVVPFALSVISKSISNSMYNKYLNSTNQENINKYYKNANGWNKSAIVFAGISSSFYIYDIIWVFRQGLKNNKEKNKIKQKISINKLQVQYQSIH